MEIKAPRLPIAFREVEYLESTGEQYIDTGYIPSDKTSIKTEYLYEKADTYGVIFGCCVGSPSAVYAGNGVLRILPSKSNASLNRVGWGDTTSGSMIAISDGAVENTKYSLHYDKADMYIDNVLVGTSATGENAWEGSYPIYLFARNSNGAFNASNSFPAKARIYNFQCFDDNVLTLDLVPCVRVTDGKPGFYDLVSNDFKVNGASGADFIIGADVPFTERIYANGEEVQRVYGKIGESTGKNLFNVAPLYTVGGWDNTKSYLNIELPLEPNTTYTFSCSENNMYKDNPVYMPSAAWAIYMGETQGTSTGNVLIGNTGTSQTNVKTKYTFTTTDKPYYFNFYTASKTDEARAIVFDRLVKNIQIEKGSVATEYEPYGIGTPIFGVIWERRYDILPSGYRAVEYLESDKNQYIDTGYIPNSNERIELSASMLELSGNPAFFGTRTQATSASTDSNGLLCLTSNKSFRRDYYGRTIGSTTNITVTAGTKYDFVLDKGDFYLNGVLQGNRTNNGSSSIFPIWIFCFNTDSETLLLSKMRLYSFSILEDGALKLYLIPCVRESDSKPGLYDSVSGAFLVNKGSGEFTVNEDI